MSTRGQGRGTRTRPQRGSANAAADAVAQLTRGQRMLMRRVQDLPQDFQKAFFERRVRMSDTTEYVIRRVSDSSVTELLDSTTKPFVGISTFDGTKLSGNKAMIVQAIKISLPNSPPATLSSGSHTDSTALLHMQYTNFQNTTFALLMAHGEFFLTIASTEVFRISISRLLRDATSMQDFSDGIRLETPIFINTGVDVKATIVLPEGVGLANVTNLNATTPVRAAKLELIGQGLRIVSSRV